MKNKKNKKYIVFKNIHRIKWKKYIVFKKI